MASVRSFLTGALLLSSSALALSPITSPAWAQEGSPFKLQGELKGQYLYEDNRDLGTGSISPDDSKTLDARLKLSVQPSSFWEAYFEGSAVKIIGTASGEDETGRSQSQGKYAELRQSWVQFNEIFGITPLDAQIGRQRISEPYAFMWNKDTDAVRLKCGTTTLNGFVGVAEDLASYRTSGDDFQAAQDNITNYMAEVSWSMDYHTLFELRALHENDHSGSFIVGDTFDPTHRDDTDNSLTWVDARASGGHPIGFGPLTNMTYRMDGAVVVGEIESTSSSAITGSDRRTVTGLGSRDVLGYAFDGDVSFLMSDTLLSPSLTLGYAYGSGDDGQGTDGTFYQPDLAGNSSRQGFSSSSSHNYGEALRPDLSNLHILKVGSGIRVMQASDLTLTYRSYWLDDKSAGLVNDHLAANVNGTDNHVGQALDVVYNINLDQEIPALMPIADADFKITVGAFKAGEAYGAADGENSFRGRVDLRFRF